MKNFSVITIFIIAIILIPFSAIGAIEYKLINSINLDFGSAKRVQYDIEVAEGIEEKDIRSVLHQAVKDLAKKRTVDALIVRLFLKDTHLPYARAVWAPEGDWGKAGKGISKSFFKTSVQILQEREKKSNKVDKGGLSYSKRKKIFKEIIVAEKKARIVSEEKYPNPNDFMKQIDYEDILLKENKREIYRKYEITDEQYSKISVEGVKNNWPR